MLVLGISLVLYGGAEAKDLLLKYIVGYPTGKIGHTAVFYLAVQNVSQGTGTEANYGTTLAEHIDSHALCFECQKALSLQPCHDSLGKLGQGDFALRILQSGDAIGDDGFLLLREGLDLPEVQLVAIMDADKEGFLRSERSLTQTAGRAARNADSLVIMYADKITDSMRKTIDETARRREIQMAYNIEHGISPKTIIKAIDTSLSKTMSKQSKDYIITENNIKSVAEESQAKYKSEKDIKKAIAEAKKEMEKAVKELDFIEAAKYRDIIIALEERLKK